jgi:hypothetical protein
VYFSHILKFGILGCNKTTPLIGISPKILKSGKEKIANELFGRNQIDERCIRHHGWGVLRFLHTHLVYTSSSIVLDERLGPDPLRGSGKSIDGDLDIDDEGSKQNFKPLQSLHHCSVDYQSV